MCFSAEASFAAGGVLVPVGAYCLAQAVRKKPRTWVWGIVPLGFGLQQVSEGFVWHGIMHPEHHAHWLRPASLAFLFFALAFWPFWFCFTAAYLEPVPRKRRIFTAIAWLATGWFWLMYYPLLTGPPERLQIEIVHHSIQYFFPDLAIYDFIPRNPLRVLYLASVAVPIACSTDKGNRVPGVLLLLSAVISFLFFRYAFVSVWCFFAAVLSAYLAWTFHRMPKAGA